MTDGAGGRKAHRRARPGAAGLPRRRHDPRPGPRRARARGPAAGGARPDPRSRSSAAATTRAARSSRASPACRTSTTSRRATSTSRSPPTAPGATAPALGAHRLPADARRGPARGGARVRAARSSTSRLASRRRPRGIHLFVEKPSAPDDARAESLADAFRAAGKVAMVGLFWRHSEAFQRAARMAADPAFGATLLFDGLYLSPGPRVGLWGADGGRLHVPHGPGDPRRRRDALPDGRRRGAFGTRRRGTRGAAGYAVSLRFAERRRRFPGGDLVHERVQLAVHACTAAAGARSRSPTRRRSG